MGGTAKVGMLWVLANVESKKQCEEPESISGLEDTMLRLESLMRRFRLQGGRTWLQLLRSCAFPRQGVLFQAEAESTCGDSERKI